MYINDIFYVSKLFKFILLADDTNMLYCINNDINALIRQINAELDKLNVLFSLNRLSLNIAKTNYIIFFGKSRIENASLYKNKQVHN